ncbi:S1 family peptidase [Actinophytocola algeriensis]|uniref:Streptogrisin C n=1 Tax=Actinophytocola algeriensis TaxID=1768010 RepID=A0A7W7Q8U3_9PSEU|nr:S1 family peptidase [Actinophytocola algeriensis]MBB4909129.1 streptogrisin C [Actinophytocola algeriensis]MBE1474483.1 streptogrisin C [Actinophytocola algeriensis]
MDRRLRSGIFVAALITGLATAPAATAAPPPAPSTDGMLAAMQRDLGLTADQATTRLATEKRANATNLVLRKDLGDTYVGGWLADGELVVAVTSTAAAGEVRSRGAAARVVARSEKALDNVRFSLDRNKLRAPKTVPGWYVDTPSNTVVVLSRADATAAAWRFVRSAGVPENAVRVVASDESPRPLIDVVGGNAYYIGSGTRCSVGFSVQGGFVTAGHCGRTGATTTQPSGRFAGSSFPGNDYAYVQVNAGNTPVGAVNNYAGGRVAVAGSQDAAVGSTVCRSGSTTGWHCGSIQARNASVTYPEGTITGLIRTNVCAEPGDSGGSLVAGSQAQGVTSGGSGNCRSGGTTFFQPVNEILQAYNLTLVTDGGGEPPGGECEGSITGNLASGASAIQPNGGYYQSTGGGAHTGCLDGPSGTDFDLYLQKWNGASWTDVASATSPNPDETLTYNGTAGYYRYRVHAYSGSGTYTLGYTRP